MTDPEYGKVTITVETLTSKVTRTYPLVINAQLAEDREQDEPAYLGTTGRRLPWALLAINFTFTGTALRDENGLFSLTERTDAHEDLPEIPEVPDRPTRAARRNRRNRRRRAAS